MLTSDRKGFIMSKHLTHNQIMARRFKCDDGIWRGVFRYTNGAYILVVPGPDGKTIFQEIKDPAWFSGRDSERVKR